MSLSVTRSWFTFGIWGLALIVVLSLFETTDAYAARRRGRGFRRGGAARVSAGGRRRGGRRAQQRGRQVVRRRVNPQQNRQVQAAPANGAVANNNDNNNQNFDFGPASVNPASLGLDNQGLQPVAGFNNLARDRNGNFVELNSGSVVNGGFVVGQNAAVRQQLLGANGSIIAGSQGQMLPETRAQVQAFNRGEIPVSAFPATGSSGRGSTQVVSLRR